MTVFAQETDTLPVWQVRKICAEIANKEIDKGTFSRWCGRFGVSGESIARIPIEVASSLATFAMLHAVDARRLDGSGYKRLYPLIHRRMLELYGRTNENQWRYAADTSAAEAEQG